MKIEQAKQIASKAVEELSHALEAGHSEKLKEYLGAMAAISSVFVAQHHAIASQRQMLPMSPISHLEAAWPIREKRREGNPNSCSGVLREEAESKQKDENNEEHLRFRAAYVFDMTDTDGKPFPQFGSTEGDPSTHRAAEAIPFEPRNSNLSIRTRSIPRKGNAHRERL